jgi:hypothetical protein
MAAPNPSKPDVGDVLMVIREWLRYPTFLVQLPRCGELFSVLRRTRWHHHNDNG